MNYTDYIALNDYTDEKNYELIIRIFRGSFSFGWYRCANSKKAISDSQFDVTGLRNEDDIRNEFNCYYVSELYS
jgi:hypothetical protein